MAGRPPGQANKLTREMKERAAFHGDKALQKIVSLIDSADEKVALEASKALMDRAYGKPAQQQIITGDEDGGPVKHEAGLNIIYGTDKLSPAGSGSGSVLDEQRSPPDAAGTIRIG